MNSLYLIVGILLSFTSLVLLGFLIRKERRNKKLESTSKTLIHSYQQECAGMSSDSIQKKFLENSSKKDISIKQLHKATLEILSGAEIHE